MRVITVDASELIRVRRRLQLTQAEFAARLGVSRRTVIRGELRGIELPWGPWNERWPLRERWNELQELATKADVIESWAERRRLARSRRPGGAVLPLEDDELRGAMRGDTPAGISPEVSPRARVVDGIPKKSRRRRKLRPRRDTLTSKRKRPIARAIAKVSRPIARRKK